MANRDYQITGPDGSTFTINGPDNATPQQIRAAAEAAYKARGSSSEPVDDIPKMLPRQRATALAGAPQRAMHPGDLLGGAIAGAADIGATLTTMPGKGYMDRRAAKVQDVQNALEYFGADPKSAAYKIGRLGANVAGTAGVGPALGTAAEAVGVGPVVVNALRTGGMSTGANPVGVGAKVADMATRVVGGGATGAAATALADPKSTVAGGAIGAATPPALKAIGTVGRAAGKVAGVTVDEIKNALTPSLNRSAKELINALDITPQDLPSVIEKLRNAEVLVPGSAPTVAQALNMPQASVLDRVVFGSPGGRALQDVVQAQAEARMNALNGVAPIAPSERAQIVQDTGEAIGRYARPEEKRISQQISDLYAAIDPNAESRITLPLSQMKRVKDQYLGAGTVGSGADANAVLREANRIGTMDVPAIKATSAGQANESLLQFVKRSGGISERSVAARELSGEVRDLKQSGLGRVVYKNGGKSLTEITEKAYEGGFIPDEDPALLLDMLRNNGRNTYGSSANFDRQYGAMRDAAMGDAPQAERIAVPVTYQEMQNLRSSMGELATAADAKGKTREAAALRGMVGELDGRLNAIADGRGTVDDYFPQEMVDKWRGANAAHSNKMERFHTGPQASIFRNGADGQPVVNGGEIAAKFWGNRPGLADDVKSFRRLIDDNPALLGQFRSMVTTEGAATAGQGKTVLGDKFATWVSNTLPGLRELFSPAEVSTLQRIAQDINRANAAANLGKGVGSNTHQNAANALDAGLLGSPLAKAIANRLPGVRAVAEPLRAAGAESASKAKAARLANLLADSRTAANALSTQELSPVQQRISNLMDMGPRAWTSPINMLNGASLEDLILASPYRMFPVAPVSIGGQ